MEGRQIQQDDRGEADLLSDLLTLGSIHLGTEGPGDAALQPIGIDLLDPQPVVTRVLSGLDVEVGTDLSRDQGVLLA
jgi:hypothetical protein